MIRLAILGTGYMAAQRASALAALEDVRITHIGSRQPDKAAALAESVGAKAVDYDAALCDTVDAVVVCLPNAQHVELARRALEAAKHVMVEYPLCTTPDEFEKLTHTAQAAHAVLVTGNTIIHETMWHYIQQHQSRLGQLLSGASRVAAYDGDLAGQWFMQPAMTGGSFASFHYHHIEYYRRLFGEVTGVWACDQQISDESNTASKHIVGGTLTLQHRPATSTSITPTSTTHWYLAAHSSGGEPGVSRCLWLNGSQDTLTLMEQGDRCLAVWGQGGKGREETFAHDWGVAGSCRTFVQAITGEVDYQSLLANDARTLEVAWAAQASAATGERVTLDEKNA